MNKKRQEYIGIIIVLIVLSFIFLKSNKNPNNIFTAKHDLKEIVIERNIKIPKGETKEFIFPEVLVNIGMSSTETADVVVEDIEDGGRIEKVQNNGDGTVSLWVTGEQLESWIDGVEEKLNELVSEIEEKGIDIEISSDWSEITYHVTKECKMSLNIWPAYEALFMGMLLEAQVFTGVEPGNIHLHVMIIQEKIDRVLVDVMFPGGKLEITDEQWKEGLSGEPETEDSEQNSTGD